MWYVYILRCVDSSLYTGITNDLENRLSRHNSKRGGAYTRSRVPVKFVYTEKIASKSRALKREAQIKKWSKNKKEALVSGDFEQLSKLSHRHGKKLPIKSK